MCAVVMAFRWILRIPVGKYYDFVYAEDSESAGYVTGHGGS